MKVCGGIWFSDEQKAFAYEAAGKLGVSFSKFAGQAILESAAMVLRRKAPRRPAKVNLNTLTNDQREAIEKILRGEK